MRRLSALVASGLLFGGVLVGSPSAWADHSAGDLEDFELTGEFTDFDYEDHGKDGFSKGDVVTFAMDLTDEHGDEAGDGEGTCEVTRLDRDAHEFAADCESVFHLDDGDLEMSGEVTDEDFRNKEVTQDIDGGTDAYDGASGTVTFTPAGGHGKGGGHHHAAGAGRHGGGHGKHGHGDHKVDIDVDFD